MRARVSVSLSLLLVSLTLVGCGGKTSSAPTPKSEAPLPEISFSAQPQTIAVGESSTLSWTVTNASSVIIDQGVGTVAVNGSVVVSPVERTTYTATARGAGGTATASVTVAVTSTPPPPPSPSANVLTWHNDNGRTGLNANEATLTPANVQPGKFGKLFSYVVDGYIYAQPLYVSQLSVNGAPHNVVFVATEYDSVYAFDADSPDDGSPLWKRSLLNSGETPVAGGNPKPWIGITSTPVIDLNRQTMYVVSTQQTPNGPSQRLHALDITTGNERTGSPVQITASVPSTAPDAVNGMLTLNAGCLQRAALLLANGTIVIGFGNCAHGWLLAYDASTLAQTAILNLAPNQDGYGRFPGAGGIWMAGGGPAADSSGNIYVSTSDGPFDGTNALSTSVLRMNSQLTVLDSFTPFDEAFLTCKDADLGSAATMLIPGSGQLVNGGKGGKLYLLNNSSLGKKQANDAGAAEWLWYDASKSYTDTCTDSSGTVLAGQVATYQFYGTPAWFNGSIFVGADGGPIRQFAYSANSLTPGAIAPPAFVKGNMGVTPVVSANGSSNGIVWALDHGIPVQSSLGAPTMAVLHAYDATDVSKELYNSANDSVGFGIKFTSPIVANGKVYFGTAKDPLGTASPQGELEIFGLK